MPARIEFEGAGEPLMETVRKGREGIVALNAEVEKTNASTKKFGQEGTQAMDKFAQGSVIAGGAIAEVNKQAGSGFITKLSKDVADAAKSAQVFGVNMAAAGDLSEAAFEELVTNAKAAAREQGLVVKSIDDGKRATVDALVAAKALTAQEGKLAIEALEVVEAFRAQEQNAGKAAVGLQKSATAGGSLRTQLRAAKEELARLEEQSDGKLTPELIAAAQRAAQLDDRFRDVNATIQAFNPDAKFQAFTQVVQAGAGALTAFQGIMGLVNVESAQVQQTLLKVQSALAITQGLQAFFGGFRDGVRNIRAVLLSLTVAQKASTVATLTDVGAKGAQTTATAATTAATGGLTAAFNALKVAVSTNPLTALVVLLAAAALAMAAFVSGTKEATATYEELLEAIKKGFDLRNLELEVANARRLVRLEEDHLRRVQEVADGKRKSAEQTREEIAKQAAFEQALDNETTLLILSNLDDKARKIQDLEDLVNKGFLNDPSPKQRENALSALGLPDDATLEEAQAAFAKFEDEFQKEKAAAILAIAQIDQRGLQGASDRLDKQNKLNADRIRDTKAFNDALLKEIERLEKEVTARLDKAKFDAASPRERIELEQQARQKEIDQLQLNLARKLAVLELEKTLSVEAIKDLSEAELNARADALIASGKVRLSPEEVESLNALRFFAEQQGEKAISDLLVKEANARIEIIANAQDKEQALFEAGLQAKLTSLRENSISEEEVQAFADQQRAAFTAKRIADAINTEERIALAQIDAQIAAAGENERAVFKLELRKLNIQRGFAVARLNAIKDDGTKETAALLAEAEAVIAGIDAARSKLSNNAPKFSLLDLLGIKKEDQAAVSQGLNELLSSVQSIIASSIAAQQEEIAARTAATDAILTDAARRRTELEKELDKQLANQRAGLANNVRSTQEALDAVKREEQKALDEKKRIAEEQKKIARQQAIADSIAQGSALLTAGAKLFSSEVAKGGLVGVVTAIAGIAAMIAAFINLKASVSKFGHGGVHMLQGPDHFHGGLAVIDRRTGQVQAEAEGGEAAIGFVRREKALKAMPMLKAINDGDMERLHALAAKEIRGITTQNNIHLDRTEVSKVAAQKEQLQITTTIVQRDDNDGLRKEMRAIGSKVDAFMRQEGNKPQETVLPSGTRIVKTPGVVRKIKPKQGE